DVMRHTLPGGRDAVEVTVLDSTHPEAVKALLASHEPSASVYLVSSKSGTTTEPLCFQETFWTHAVKQLGGAQAGDSFVAITDSGSKLAVEAANRGYRRAFINPEDIAQDTFVQLLRRPPSAETPLRPWLVRVAINRAYNELRANRRRYEREAREFRERHASNEPSSEAASANLIAERELVRQTLLELPERSREILGLRAEGFSYLDIASAMQISPGSVGTLLARAERAFRLSYEARRGGM
ncbi:MAG: sigma-70 family RNA polymerase sigma factor, partial [Proteobacteria bacterium]|nr:sigma-70 family RNA polymerase sigma factor [Pseudomonadota bacterium]